MNDDQILDLLKEALVYADEEKESLTQNMNMDAKLAELGVESVAAMEMAGFIEEKLNILFPDDELASVSTVRDFVDLIRRNA